MAKGKTVSLVDVAYCASPSPGFDVTSSLKRLDEDCNLLWENGVFSRPYLRLDWAPDITLYRGVGWGAPDRLYNREAQGVMEWWTAAPRAQLTIIVGNEPNMTNINPADVASAVKDIVAIRDILGYDVRVFAPAIAPWNPNNVPDPADFYPSPRGASTEWENQQYGLARRLADVNLDGYAIHAYGRPWHIFDREEPFRYTLFDQRGASNGFLWLQNAKDAIRKGDPRELALAITETNTFTDRHTSESYPGGWLQNAAVQAERFGAESLSVFVGEPHGEGWAQESTKLRIGQCAVEDDDFNSLIR